MEIMRCKVVDAKDNMNEFVGILSQKVFDLHASLRHIVNQSLLFLSNCLKELTDREAMVLQQSGHNDFRNVADGV